MNSEHVKLTDSNSYRCFKGICLWSLVCDLIVVISFFASFSVSFIYHDWGYVGWIVPLVVKLFFMFCFAIMNGYFALILYLEYSNKHDLPLMIIDKTEAAFNKIIKNDTFKTVIGYISILLFIINMFIYTVNFYLIFVSLITFAVLICIRKICKK